jgi:large subunit ribosomal protein L17
MRHGNKVNHLGRTVTHRRALLKNLAVALITHKRIETTLAKAKSLRRYIEPLITKSRDNTTHSRRVVFSYLQSKDAVKELFGTIAAEVGSRPGGYVRIIRTGFRRGDAAEMALIELVDFNKDYAVGAAGDGKKKRRRRKGGASAANTAAASSSAVQETPQAAAEEAASGETGE